jgi:hypothetical protein
MKISEELIWKYVEGKCDPLESSSVKQGIETNEEVRTLYEDIRAIHVHLSRPTIVSAPKNLSNNVMQSIQSSPKNRFTSFNGIRLILGLSAIAMVTVYFLLEGGVIESGSARPFGPLSEIGVLDGIDWNLGSSTYLTQVGLVLFGVMLCLLMDEFLSARLGRKFLTL